MTVSRFWREIDARYTLTGAHCKNCGHTMFPPRALCPKCRHASVGKLEPKRLAGEGVVEEFTVVHKAPVGFELQAPYVMALVKLAEGPRVLAQIVDTKPGDVREGAKVRAAFRRINEDGEAGVVHYGYKFVVSSAPEQRSA
ncbi:MAG: Zn-ribbon domain-containing OB-fold protein [Thermoplasmatota archaeon]